MKAIRFIMCAALGTLLMMCANSCANKHTAKETASSKSSEAEKVVKSPSTTSEKLVLIDFYATWCGPCKAMTPVMEQLEKKYGDKIEFKKVDIDENPELAEKYRVEAVPTFVFLLADDEIKRVVGYHDASEMTTIFDGILK